MHSNEQRRRFERALTPAVYRRAWLYACRFTQTREDAEDLLQESLAHAFRKLDQLRDAERFKPWLMSIVRSRFLNDRRRMSVEIEDSYWMEAVSAAEPDNPLSEPLAAALSQLPKAQRELLCLFYLDGLNQQETGQVLGIAPHAVGQRLFRARRSLRRLLEESQVLGELSQEKTL